MTIYPKIIHNGHFVDAAAATIPIFTPALVGALGVYETILARRGRYVALIEHLEIVNHHTHAAISPPCLP